MHLLVLFGIVLPLSLIVACLILGYFFYTVSPLKPTVDHYLTEIFRESCYKADEAAGRTVYKRPDEKGFDGLMTEMKAVLAKHKNDPEYLNAAFCDSMDLFFSTLGVPPEQFATFCQKYPKAAAFLNRVTANISFSWVVGGAPIEHLKDDTVFIRRCHFREQIGEDGCQKLCQQPVSKYFGERMNAPLAVVPQPRQQGLGCRICYGSSCLPKELEW